MRQYFFSLFIIMMFLNCSSKKSEEKNKSEDDVSVADTSYINVIMENDTLDMKLEKGVIKYFYKLNDTIKLSPNDDRRVSVILVLSALGENKEKFGAGKKIKKELRFSPINTHDTISIPFTIKPHFYGKGVIVGVLTDMYFIHTSVKDTLRVLTYDNTFKKDVYIKGLGSD